MADRIIDSGWVDRYVRNELSTDEELEFEAALFDSPALRGDVEAALSLQSLLDLEGEAGERADSAPAAQPRRQPRLQPLAIAASLLVGALGLSMWLQRGSEVADLERQISELNRPYGEVTIRRLDVMRSSGTTPAHLLRKTADDGLLVLDIELSASARRYDELDMFLQNGQGGQIASWRGSTIDRERVTLAIPSSRISAGMATLEMRAGGEVIEVIPIEILPYK